MEDFHRPLNMRFFTTLYLRAVRGDTIEEVDGIAICAIIVRAYYVIARARRELTSVCFLYRYKNNYILALARTHSRTHYSRTGDGVDRGGE